MSQILSDMANSVANEMLSPCELLGLYYHPFLRSIWEVVSKQLIVPSSAPLQGRVWTNEYSKFHKYVIGWHLPWRITSIRILWIVVQILFYDLNEHSDSDFLCGLKSNTFCIPVSMGLLLKYYYDILLFNTKYLYDVFRNRLRQSILFLLRFTTISGDRYYWHRITRLILDVSLVLHFCVYYAYKIVFKKEEDWSLFRFLRARSTQRNGKVVILNYLVIPIHNSLNEDLGLSCIFPSMNVILLY